MKIGKFLNRVVVAFFVGNIVLMSAAVHAYEEVSVKDGASISGVVTLSGPVPPPFSHKLTMGAYPEHCQPVANKDGNVLLPRARVSKEHAVADVVVYIQGLERGKAPAAHGPKLTVNRCQFDQLVMAGMDGTNLRMVMNDTVLHPLRGWEMVNEGRIPLFHIPDLETGNEKTAELKTRKSGVVMIECDQHRYMQAWILVPLNPYFATTDTKGHFTIDAIPPGQYTLSIWHPSLGYREQLLAVKANEQKDIPIRFNTSPAKP
ncbi:MAG: hypothetical protein ACPGYT_00235 [Nitrospirales bacterium]